MDVRTLQTTCRIACVAMGCMLAATDSTQAQFSFGRTEQITYVDELPDEVRVVASEVLSDDCRIGYFYEGFHLLLPLNLWTWNGQFVVYHNERRQEYLEMHPEDWDLLVGYRPASVYRTPLGYRVPPGLATIFVLCAGACGYSFVKRRRKRREETDALFTDQPPSEDSEAPEIFEDPRYERALDVYMSACTADENPLLVIDHAFDAAVSYLRDQENVSDPSGGLLQLLQYFAVERAEQLRVEAVEAEQAEEWSAAQQAYAEAAELMHGWDPDVARLLTEAANTAAEKS